MTSHQTQSGQAPTRACDLCQGSSSEALLSKNGADYRRCLACGFVFGDYSQEEWDQRNADAFEASLEEYAAKSYTPAKQRRYGRRLSVLEPYRGGGNLLEIGSNVGGFLHAARSAGWSPVGIEPVAACAEYARSERGLQVHACTLEVAELPSDHFDALYSNAVFEHLWSPTRTLAEATRVLRPGGVVFLDTVNYDSYTRRFLEEKWKLYDPAMHACIYTPDTLKRLCMGAGLTPLWMRSHRVHLRPNAAPRLGRIARRVEELVKLPFGLAARWRLRGESIQVLACK
ncbi:MAG: class I SAM-dependent methyltransferase [Planctomycetota bacterium]|nr:class I SAM-dependent methyltransferase [Planctomycetota bacterium]